MKNYYFNKYDNVALKKIYEFLPEKIFDSHMHLSLSKFAKGVGNGRKVNSTYEDYINDMAPYFLYAKCIKTNIIIEPDECYKNDNLRQKSVEFLVDTLNKHPNSVGEIVIMPNDTEEKILSMLVHKRIIGFKCYHYLANYKNTWNLNIEKYLPESAWKIANEKNMCITLHLVKDNALADSENLVYIKKMANKYPNANLILAHCGRSFSSWTAVENVEKLKKFKNIYFDLSAICESPSIFQIFKKIGTKRCMWGSDYSCCMLRGKAISIADTFYWIYNNDLENFKSKTKIHSWLIGTENLMAIRQACIMAELNKKDIEDIFYNNANKLFNKAISL